MTLTDKLEFKVSALTKHAVAPHYYGFTWSLVGVATEYLEDTIVLINFIKTSLPSISERKTIIIDHKTLRHSGHYAWIQEQL